jgi:hypothetical protein
VQASVPGRSVGATDVAQRILRSWREDARWHVSPAIDLAGYAFGWVFIALPAIFLIDTPGPTGLLIYFATGSLIDVHRHYTFSYVYLDGEVRRRYPVRFFLLPALCLVSWTQMPALARSMETVGAAEAGALAVWLWLAIQLAWQDQGGAFQWRATIPLFLGGISIAAALSSATAIVSSGWIWLSVGVSLSLLLHVLVASDDAGRTDGRAHRVFPVVALALVGAVVALSGGARFPASAPCDVLMLTFAVWQTFHVIMQKYGILRVYSARSGQPDKVPGWVDRLLVVSPGPAFVVWAGTSQLDTLAASLASGNEAVGSALVPLLRLLGEHSALLMAVGGAFWLAAIALFVEREWRVHRLRNGPRLGFALGTMLLYAAVFQLGLAKGYIVFASSHGLEYMVFIWAYQRRRYRDEATLRAASPLLRYPVALYLSFTAVVMGALFYANYSYQFPALEALPRTLFQEDVRDWLLWFTLYHGVLHFYYDGFLWKLRRPGLLSQI